VPGQRADSANVTNTVTLEPVVADAVARAGYDLEDLHVQQAGRRRLVKVVVDRDSDTGIGLDQVADVSRAVSAALDSLEEAGSAGSPLGGPYTLEVTSPGLDRPLTKPRHWRRARLRKVAVRLAEQEKLTGRVGDADPEPDGGVALLVAGELRRVAYADIEHAVVEVEFAAPPAAEIAKLEQGEEGSR
jgi:ribosome maturation factor RimP